LELSFPCSLENRRGKEHDKIHLLGSPCKTKKQSARLQARRSVKTKGVDSFMISLPYAGQIANGICTPPQGLPTGRDGGPSADGPYDPQNGFCSVTADGYLVADAIAARWLLGQGFNSLKLLLGEPVAALIEGVVKNSARTVETLQAQEPLEVMFARARTLEDRLIRALDKPEPLIPDLVWPKTITMIFGPTGVGKSSLLTQIMLAAVLGKWPKPRNRMMIEIASGLPDLPAPKKPLRVLYIGPEDSAEMYEEARLPRPVAELFAEAKQRFVYFNERVIIAGEGEQLRDLIAWLKAREETFDVIVFDTVSRAHLGLDENKNSDMARVMAAFDAIRMETGASVFFTHHMNKFGARAIRHYTNVRRDPTQARGASVFADQSHMVLSLTVGEDRDTLVLTWTKSNYDKLRLPIAFKRDESGLFVPVQSENKVWEVRETLQAIGGHKLRKELVGQVAAKQKVTSKWGLQAGQPSRRRWASVAGQRGRRPRGQGKICVAATGVEPGTAQQLSAYTFGSLPAVSHRSATESASGARRLLVA
jgi:AAA domain-containing protein